MSESVVPSRAVVLEKLRTAFAKVTPDDQAVGALTESARLRDDLGLDSFAALELIFELEDLLHVRISKSAAVTFQTVGDVISFVVAELSAPAIPVADLQGGVERR
jgi:acyl carrier protein